jgi:DegV family protein with EDD domain
VNNLLSNVAIVTDGASDLTVEMMNKYDITVIPYRVIFDEEVYRIWCADKTTISPPEFYSRLDRCTKETLPHTSVPSPKAFIDAFDEALNKADSVIALFLSSKMSGTVQSAKRIVQAKYNGADITIFDTKQVMSGVGIQALEAARMAKNGAIKKEILARLETLREQVHLSLFLSNIEYLYLSDRIGKAKRIFAKALKMYPVLYAEEGTFDSAGILRGRDRMIEQIIQYGKRILNKTATQELFFWHTKENGDATRIYEKLQEANSNDVQIHFHEAAPIAGVYAGPNAFSITYIGDWDKKWLTN